MDRNCTCVKTHNAVKALSIFLATSEIFGMLKIYQQTLMQLVFANFTYSKGRIALQIARKIASCDRALNASKLISQSMFPL